MEHSEAHLRILRLLESNPDLSQRDIARELGISLGKTNYCLKALIEKGFIKARKFTRNPNKGVYAYLLTPKGIAGKMRITRNFLNRKMVEYEALEEEIRSLTEEVRAADRDGLSKAE